MYGAMHPIKISIVYKGANDHAQKKITPTIVCYIVIKQSIRSKYKPYEQCHTGKYDGGQYRIKNFSLIIGGLGKLSLYLQRLKSTGEHDIKKTISTPCNDKIPQQKNDNH